jgi:hypothetical protein
MHITAFVHPISLVSQILVSIQISSDGGKTWATMSEVTGMSTSINEFNLVENTTFNWASNWQGFYKDLSQVPKMACMRGYAVDLQTHHEATLDKFCANLTANVGNASQGPYLHSRVKFGNFTVFCNITDPFAQCRLNGHIVLNAAPMDVITPLSGGGLISYDEGSSWEATGQMSSLALLDEIDGRKYQRLHLSIAQLVMGSSLPQAICYKAWVQDTTTLEHQFIDMSTASVWPSGYMLANSTNSHGMPDARCWDFQDSAIVYY